VTTGGDRAEWLNDMFANLKENDQVIGAIYFSKERDNDYRVLTDGSLDPAFRDGYSTWSPPRDVSWIFDGRMDTWVNQRRQAYGSGFLDIRDHIFETAIGWLAAKGITTGCNPPLNTRFCPDEPVTRGQMAVFVARALELPAPSGDYFDDDEGHFYESAANRLYEAGITEGCAPSRYCGGSEISREQMAAFIARLLGLAPASRDYFDDDSDSIFEGAINKVAQAEITLGCNPPANDNYCPGENVTRGQMATFLRRALRG
jgi:hypothetical protein